ncbi:GatB/YqeY domain-containing protein [Breoghania sp.]|uniref:GatB/YqeY domain-containing protein n=1 Tax=Breoghania sp. TaxID=2065378 RepID=UPI0026326268|nr:GatB/YqeY domain-containing protein [Breoghania sp.]MDJ0932593.1 GatB/YqeY domain-containing protein [Breoghania sp.]
MRDRLNAALADAVEKQDKRRAATLRLILAAINDRADAARAQGRDGVELQEITDILSKMVQQREGSAVDYEEAGQLDLAQQERDEAAIILEFLPKQLDEDDTKAACKAVVNELGCKGLRDMGRTMAVLKERYPGQMDFGRASCVVRSLLH